MANRFLSNITINDSYTLPSADGAGGQVIGTDGAGNLSFVDQTTEALTLNVTVKNISGGSLAKGTIVHAHPSANPPSGNVVEVIAADYDTSASMPAIGVLNETLANEAEGQAIMFGAVSGIDTSSFSAGDELWVGNNGAFTNTKPATAGQLIQKIAVVIKSHASNGLIKIFGAGRTNDVPLPLYIDNTNQRVGIGQPTPSYHLDISGNTRTTGNLVGGNIYSTTGQFTFGSSANNGEYISSVGNDIRFTAGGSVVLTIDGDDSRVGIGTTSPSQKLNIYANDANTQPLVRIENDGTGDAALSFVATGIAGWSMGLDNSDFDVFKLSTDAGSLSAATKVTVDRDGNMTVAGDVTANHYFADTHFRSTDTAASLSTTGAGIVYLRPNGYSSTSGQAYLSSNGILTLSDRIVTGGAGLITSGDGSKFVQLGDGRTDNNYAYIDLIGDTTYADYGLRVMRNNGGPNTTSQIVHRGTGEFQLRTLEAAPIVFQTGQVDRFTINGSGGIDVSTNMTFGQGDKIIFPDNTSVPDNPTNEQVDYITFGSNGSISQVSGRGALMITSSDDSLILAGGDVGRDFVNTNIDADAEGIVLLSDGQVDIYSDLQDGWDGLPTPWYRLRYSGNVLTTYDGTTTYTYWNSNDDASFNTVTGDSVITDLIKKKDNNEGTNTYINLDDDAFYPSSPINVLSIASMSSMAFMTDTNSNGTTEHFSFYTQGTTDATATKLFEINQGGNVGIVSGSLLMGGTTVIDSSRNLTNIGTISSGDITISKQSAIINMGYQGGPHGINFYDDSNGNNDLRWAFYYRTSPDTITFETGGTSAKFTLDTSGNLDITGDLSAVDVNLTGALKGPSTFYIDPSPDDTGEPGGATTDTGTVVILGDLQVTGTTTTIDSTTLNVGDKNIVLAKDATTAAAANGGGITINGANATMTYNSTDDRFEFNKAIRSSSHVLAGSNVYSGDASSFRNYGGVWKATTGLTGNGFQFVSADGTAMTISSTGFVDINNGLLVNGGGSNFDTIRIEAPNASVYFKDTTSGVGAWHIGHNDSFLYVLEDTDGNGVYNNINARWDTGGYEQYTGNIDNRVGSYQIAGVNVIDSSRNISASGATFDSNVNIVKNNVGIITAYSSSSIEATDAQLDIISSSAGTWGSAINLVEGTDSTANTDIWSIARTTTGGNGDSSLNFNFGTTNRHDNETQVKFTSDGRIGVNTTSVDSNLAVQSDGAHGIVLKTDSADAANSGRLFFLSTSGNVGLFNNSGKLDFRTGSTPGSTSGNRKMSLTQSGDLMIGTSGSPDSMLHVLANTTNNQFILERTGTATGKYKIYTNNNSLWFYDQAQTAHRMMINEIGQVGIGTTAPSAKLDIEGSVNGEAVLLRLNNPFDDNNAASNPITTMWMNAASNNGYLRLYGAPADTASKHQFDIGSTAGSSFLTFSPGSTERMRITYGGDIGIGTISPETKLHIKEDLNSPVLLTLHNHVGDILNDGSTGNFIDFKSTDNNATYTPQVRIGMYVQDYSGDAGQLSEGVGNFVVYTGQGTDSAGNGTLRESFKVREDNTAEIIGDGAGATLRLVNTDTSVFTDDLIGSIEFYNNDADGAHVSSFIKALGEETYGRKGSLVFGTAVTNSTDAVEAMRINESGNVGINIDTPDDKLDVDGRIRARQGFAGSDGQAKEYFWHVNNVGNSGTIWKKIGTYNPAGQSSRIMITATGTASYSAGSSLGGKTTIIAQVNNNNLLEGTFWQEGMAAQYGAVGFVSNSQTSHDIYYQMGSYSEFAFEALLSDGTFTPSASTVSTPTFTHTATREWNVNDYLYVISTGEVGIGTTSPTELLDVNGKIKAAKNYIYGQENHHIELVEDTGSVYLGNVNQSAYISTGSYYGSQIYNVSSTQTALASVYLSSTGDISFLNQTFTAGAAATATGDTKMIIKTNGKVGIGELNPQTTLHLQGALTISDTGSANDTTLIQFTETQNYDQFAIKGDFAGAGGENKIKFTTDLGGGDILTMKGDGKVGVGTTPDEGLTVNWEYGASFGGKKYYTDVGTDSGSGQANGFAITLNESHGTTLTTQYSYRVWLTTTGTGTYNSAMYVIYRNSADTAWVARAVSTSSDPGSNYPQLAISGNNAIAWDNHASQYGVRYRVESIYSGQAKTSEHLLGSDVHWQRKYGNLFYTDGNVGIGTSGTPSEKLEVVGAIAAGTGDATAGSLALTDRYTGNDHIGNIGWLRSSGGVYLAYGVKQDGSADWKSTFDNFAGERSYLKLDEDSLSLAWAGANQTAVDSTVQMTDRFVFDLQNIRLGVGCTDPQTNLEIRGNAPYLTISNLTEDDAGIYFNDYQAGANPASSSQSAAIKFNSSTNHLGFFNNDAGNEVLRLASSNTAYFRGDVIAYYSFSDARLKTNVKPLGSTIDKVKLLEGVYYEWKDGDRKGQIEIGLIAQDVEKVFPEVVREQKRLGSEEEYKTVDYEKMVSVLIEAVKDQQKQIDELKAIINKK